MRHLKINFLFLLLMLGCSLNLPAKNIDSLQHAIYNSKSDTSSISLHYQISYNERRKDTKLALKHIEKGIQLSEKNDFFKYGEFFFLKSRILKHLGEFDAAICSCEDAIDVFEASDNNKKLVNAINLLGWLGIKKGDFNFAKSEFEQALYLSKMMNDSLLIAINLNDIGAVLYHTGKYPEATKYYLDALNIRENMNNEKGMMIGYNNLGIVYKKNKNSQKAIEYYNQGLEIAKRLDDKSRITSFYNNIGSLYYEIDNLLESEKYLSEGLVIATELGDKSRIAHFYYAIGALHNKMKLYPKAINNLNRSIELYKNIGEKPGIAMSMVELGDTYVNRGNIEQGILLLHQSEKVAAEIGFVQVTEEEVFEKLSRAYVAKGDYKTAFEYQNKFIEIKDATRSKEKTAAILDLQVKYEAAFMAKEKQSQIDLLDKEKILERTNFSFLLAGILFLLVVAGLLFGINQNKQKANETLNIKNAEIRAKNQELEIANGELNDAKLFAEKAANAKEEFLSTMSHEIRTPLNAVLGMTSILLDESPRMDQIENLRTLKFSANNLLTLINDILDFSKIESGRIDFEDVAFDLNRLLKDIVESFKLSKGKSTVDIVLNHEESPFQIVGDTTRLTQIFTNLIGNAVKFTQEGYVKISSELIQKDENRVKFRFAVQDTGIGIPEDRLEAIFDSFSQADANTTRLYGGTGLGLAITKRLVEMHDSKVIVESVVGKGTTFYFDIFFPISDEEKVENIPTQTSLSLNGLEGVRILLAEDNKINQLVAGKILAKWNVELDIAENGAVAVEMHQNNKYDIILMDIHMPIMDGYEATKIIRLMDSDISNIPIIALTASAFSSVAKKTTLVGMNDHVGKPFKPEELFQKMVFHLANHKKLANPIGISEV